MIERPIKVAQALQRIAMTRPEVTFSNLENTIKQLFRLKPVSFAGEHFRDVSKALQRFVVSRPQIHYQSVDRSNVRFWMTDRFQILVEKERQGFQNVPSSEDFRVIFLPSHADYEGG